MKQCITIAFAYTLMTTLFLSPISASTFQYDDLNRLTQVIYDDGTSIEYTYDPVGNRLGKIIKPGTGKKLGMLGNQDTIPICELDLENLCQLVIYQGMNNYMIVSYKNNVSPLNSGLSRVPPMLFIGDAMLMI